MKHTSNLPFKNFIWNYSWIADMTFSAPPTNLVEDLERSARPNEETEQDTAQQRTELYANIMDAANFGSWLGSLKTSSITPMLFVSSVTSLA